LVWLSSSNFGGGDGRKREEKGRMDRRRSEVWRREGIGGEWEGRGGVGVENNSNNNSRPEQCLCIVDLVQGRS